MRTPKMTVVTSIPMDGPVDLEIPELHLTATYRDKNGARKIEIHNCPLMEQEFEQLKSGKPLLIERKNSAEKYTEQMVMLWNMQLALRGESWQVEKVEGKNAIRRKMT